MTRGLKLFVGFALVVSAIGAGPTTKPKVLPYHQTSEPGPALSPQDAIAHMKLPPGFKVTLVASEPDVVNPTAFTFDDRGRILVTESVEYPRHTPGIGKDKIIVLESTKHDGHFDHVSTFKEGLNIPAGIAVGNGGVYVTNSPRTVFFLKDSELLFGNCGSAGDRRFSPALAEMIRTNFRTA